jgi:hypothetical protein
MKLNNRLYSLLLCCCLTIINSPKVLAITVDGNIRSYLFDRIYSIPTLPKQQSFSLGGKLNALTDPWMDFRVGATVYTAQPLGLNSKNLKKVDLTLPGNSITALGQAFVQYENKKFLARLGNQIINTPWLNECVSRMMPATYTALYAKLTPIADLELSAVRVTRFRPRIFSNFTRTNLYMPANEAAAIGALNNQTTTGALAIGVESKQIKNLEAQLWGYKFYDFAKFAYAEATYKFTNKSKLTPILGVELGRQTSDGNRALSRAKVGAPNSTLYGLLVGIEYEQASLSLAFDRIPKRNGAYKNGDLISPYTAVYANDPLYTTSMIAGMVEKAAGNAYKATAQYAAFAKQLKLKISYARYFTAPYLASTTESNFDITYNPQQIKDLSLRYRIGLLLHNPAYGRFVYSRLMLEYDFKIN